jgi:hypothetical protein
MRGPELDGAAVMASRHADAMPAHHALRDWGNSPAAFASNWRSPPCARRDSSSSASSAPSMARANALGAIAIACSTQGPKTAGKARMKDLLQERPEKSKQRTSRGSAIPPLACTLMHKLT